MSFNLLISGGMMRRNRTLCVAAGGIVVASLKASPAPAQDVAAARALFERGLADMEAGRYQTGCALLGEVYRIDPRPGTLFTLAECEAKRGRVATAVARYREYLSQFERMTPEHQAKQLDRDKIATKQIAVIEPTVPELTLAVPKNAPKGTVVKRDDVVLTELALGIGLPVDPGEHVVTTQAPGGAVTELRFTVALRERKHVTLEVKAATDPALEDPSASMAPPGGSILPTDVAPTRAQKTTLALRERWVVAYAAGGVGGAGLVLGGIAGGLMLSKKKIVNANCRDSNPGVKLCTTEGVAAGDAAKALGLVSTIGLVTGLAGIGGATVLLVMKPEARHRDARWIGIGALNAAHDGVVLGARGVW